MTHTQFFTDSIAKEIAASAAAAGLELPVYGQISDAEAEHDRIEVRCESTEEVIPGNYTTRLDCSVVLVLSATAHSANEIEALAADVGECIMKVLGRDWRWAPLADPREESDAEYEAAPYIVLDLVPNPANVEVAGDTYEVRMDFRAYVQF